MAIRTFCRQCLYTALVTDEVVGAHVCPHCGVALESVEQPAAQPKSRSGDTAGKQTVPVVEATPVAPEWFQGRSRTERIGLAEPAPIAPGPVELPSVSDPVETADEPLEPEEICLELPPRKRAKLPAAKSGKDRKKIPPRPTAASSRQSPLMMGGIVAGLLVAVIGTGVFAFSFWNGAGDEGSSTKLPVVAADRGVVEATPDPAVVVASAVEPIANPTPKSPPTPKGSKVPERKSAPRKTPSPKPKATPKPPVDKPSPPSPVPEPKPEPTPPVDPPANAPTELVAFRPIALDEPATSFEMTEDGRFVVITHQSANLISIYDVTAERVIETVSTESPRAVICRDGRAFVANFGKGTISVFAEAKQWAKINELQVDKPNIKYMSAAGGRNFRDELLVTCHPGGIFHLDVKKDRCRPILDKAMGTVSYDGKLVFTQDSFNTSPSGLITAWPFAEFLKEKLGPSLFQGGIQQTPYVYQVHPGGYWLCENLVFGGVPIAQVRDDTHGLLIPDYAQKVVYNLTTDVITSHRLNTSFEEFGKRKVELPEAIKKDFSRLNHLIYRRRDYLLDHPAAFTQGADLRLFAMDIKQGDLLSARTAAFATPSAAPAETPSIAATEPSKGDKPTAPMPADKPDPMRATWLESFPKFVVEGRPFAFQLPRDGGPFELMDGPAGMKLTPDRRLTWTPTADQVGVHELKIRVEQDGQSAFERPSLEVVDRALVDAVGGDLAKLGQFDHLDLDVDHLALRRSSDGKSLLLLQGDTLRILGPDGISVVKEHKLPERYHDIRDRENEFVALAKSPATIDVIDKKTLRRIEHQLVQPKDVRVMDVMDFAIHPTQPTSYLAIKHDIELPRYTVIFLQERTGKQEVPGIVGTFVQIDPQGKTLYTGYKDLYSRGSKFHINPDWRLIEIPQYGNVDMLISWELNRGRPKIKQVIREAGGNGSGIRLSPDGERVTYLSHVGHPPHTNNLVGFSTRNFNEDAVVYETKGRATTHDLDYHPTLPWAASPGGGSAVLFHRETGKLLEQRLLLTSQGTGSDTVERVLFSPDGKSLILQCKGGETGRYLRPVRLRLNQAELATAGRPPRKPPAEAPRIAPKIPAADLQALESVGKAEPITAKEIGKRYLDAVVVVSSEESSGTGFVIGKEGYILTCAHVLPRDDQRVEVHYNVLNGDKPAVVKTVATVLETDEKRDIALLKIKPRNPLPHVILSEEGAIETGESITVIGNPGLGSTILSHTMTTGIVSNPRRDLEGQQYIQTNAAVNPGNSGGPMFDGNGRVIGLVSLKGNIEGAGFAVPTSVLRNFLSSLLAKPDEK